MELENNNSNLLRKSFLWMFLGLLVTGLVSVFVLSNTNLLIALIDMNMILLLIELFVVFYFSLRINKLSVGTAKTLFLSYAVLNGLTLSPIFYIYELGSVISVFFGAAGLFLILGVIGVNTKKDLSGFGPVLFSALIIGIILSLINMFLQNPVMDLYICWGILILFCGITIYDINKIRKSNYDDEKAPIYFALELYLDFINIFIKLLRLFGDRK